SPAQCEHSSIDAQAAFCQRERPQTVRDDATVTQLALAPQFDRSLVEKRTFRLPEARLWNHDSSRALLVTGRRLHERAQRIRNFDGGRISTARAEQSAAKFLTGRFAIDDSAYPDFGSRGDH